MLLLLWKHASLIQYMWEILVTGVCIVPAWRLSLHGSFITQDSLLSLWCLYRTPRSPFQGPSPLWTLALCFPPQIQEPVSATEESAALIRTLELLFFYELYSSSVYLFQSLEAKTQKVVSEYPRGNIQREMFTWTIAFVQNHLLKNKRKQILRSTLPA